MVEACRALLPVDEAMPKAVQLAMSGDMADDVEEVMLLPRERNHGVAFVFMCS